MVIVLGISLLVILAFVSITAVSIRNAEFSKRRAQAAKYSEEGMEKIRIYRDQHTWGDFTTNCSNMVTLNIPVIPAPGFTRAVTCGDPSDPVGRKTIKVTVGWSDPKGNHQSDVISYFTEWQ
jgi:Tfp pilus assembly protein PilV